MSAERVESVFAIRQEQWAVHRLWKWPVAGMALVQSAARGRLP